MALLVDHLRRTAPRRGPATGDGPPGAVRVLVVLAWLALAVVLVTC